MARPKYTDSHKYPHGYALACDTDITKTWARARKKLEDDKKEREAKVSEIRKIGVKHGR